MGTQASYKSGELNTQQLKTHPAIIDVGKDEPPQTCLTLLVRADQSAPRMSSDTDQLTLSTLFKFESLICAEDLDGTYRDGLICINYPFS